MRIFGVSIVTIALVLVAFYFGTKNPGALARVPGLNKL